MDRHKIERCLEQVAAYRASGQKAKVWAEANGVALAMLQSWCTHARRWQARLEGRSAEPPTSSKPKGFVAACVAPGAAQASVRLELNAGGSRLDVHWPLTHTRELAALLRELGR